MIQRLILLVSVLAILSVPAWAQADPQWTHHVLWDSGEKIQGVLFADVDARRTGIEAIAVTQSGMVGMAGLEKGKPWSEVIYKHPSKLQAIAFQDVDPTIPGRELYVAGGGVSTPGQVLQITRAKNKWQVRSVWTGAGFVHGLARLEGTGRRDPHRLIVPAYDGRVYRLTPVVDGLWTEEVIYERPFTGDSAAIKFKDVAIGKVKGVNGRRIIVTALDGHVASLDPARKVLPEVVHFEARGVARVFLTTDGTLYGAANNGNVLLFNHKSGRWSVDTIFTDEKELRGVRFGTFKTSEGVARLAIYGYAGHVRALLDRKGPKLEAVSLYADTSMAHAIDMADAIKGNGNDELLIAGYAGKLIIVAHR